MASSKCCWPGSSPKKLSNHEGSRRVPRHVAAFHPHSGNTEVTSIDTKIRINDKIRAREIRVIDENGGQLGIMTPQTALALAEERGLDLVEVAPQSVPPVCRILDYGKYLYQLNKKQHDAKKKQKLIQVKEVKFRPKTEEHDYQFKKKHIERFLSEGDKVKASVTFRGREMAHPDYGRHILQRLKQELIDLALVESDTRMEGRLMFMLLAPKKA